MKYLLLMMFVVLTGCEDFLEREPLGTAIEEDFNDDVNELQLSLNAAYNVLTNYNYQRSAWLIGEGCGDDVVNIISVDRALDDARLMSYTFHPRNVWLERHWEINYRGVFRANRVIEGLSKNSADLIAGLGNEFNSLRALREMSGQAKFLRALFYFNLVRTYGDIPIKDNVFEVDGSDDNFVNPKSPRAEVYDYIERDLREAILVLRASYGTASGQEKGKAEMGAAIGLLIKVLAYRAVPGTADVRWNEIARLSNFLINSSPSDLSVREILNFDSFYAGNTEELARIQRESLRLVNDSFEEVSGEQFLNQIISAPGVYDIQFPYDKIWTKEGEFQAGSLFEISHFTPGTGDNVTITTSVFNELIRTQTSAQAAFIQPSNVASSLKSGAVGGADPRIAFSIVGHAAILPDGATSSTAIQPTGNSVLKWYTLQNERPSTGRNIPVLRLGEIYTLYAEALNELGDQVGAIDLLNTLRKRPVSGQVNNNELEVNNYFFTRDLIFAEKRAELMFEFDRFYEIVRQGNFEERMRDYNRVALPDFKKESTNLFNNVFPIPQSEVDLSNGVVSQNSGY